MSGSSVQLDERLNDLSALSFAVNKNKMCGRVRPNVQVSMLRHRCACYGLMHSNEHCVILSLSDEQTLFLLNSET